MKRFIITEEEKNHISKLHGLIKENFIQNMQPNFLPKSFVKTK